jgi:plasmid stabilization system protein ParE
MTFRGKALEDIRAIVEWYDHIDPDLTEKIRIDLQRSFRLLLDFPHAGALVAKRRFRRIVTRRYHFKIAYSVRGDHIEVLGIYRFQDRQS